LLCPCQDRPSSQATENTDKFPPPHVRPWAQETAS
jgi:hypothetical protein